MLRIVDWQKHFENNRSREIKKLDWVPFPNRHDGDGYTELLDHKDGASHYGAWCALVQVASKCDPRGTLVRDGGKPHSAATLSRMTRISERILLDAIKRLVEEVGWLENITQGIEAQELTNTSHEDAVLGSHEGAAAPHLGALNGREWNRREENGNEEKEENGTAAETCGLPDWFSDHDFEIAWLNWQQHRIEIKKPLKPTQAAQQRKHFAKIGKARSIAMMEHTIAMGWQGLKEPDPSTIRPEDIDRTPTDEDLANWNPVDGGLGVSRG